MESDDESPVLAKPSPLEFSDKVGKRSTRLKKRLVPGHGLSLTSPAKANKREKETTRIINKPSATPGAPQRKHAALYQTMPGLKRSIDSPKKERHVQRKHPVYMYGAAAVEKQMAELEREKEIELAAKLAENPPRSPKTIEPLSKTVLSKAAQHLPPLDKTVAGEEEGKRRFSLVSDSQDESKRRKTLGTDEMLEKYIDDLSSTPNSLEFTYLLPMITGTGEYNPYQFTMVEHADVDSADYYTLSAMGVTRFENGVADFTPLPKWRREREVFQKLRSIPTFYQYRQWKNFYVWKKNIRFKRISICKNQLEENLFFLNPLLRAALFQVKELAYKINLLRLYKIRDLSSYTLDEFIAAQEAHKESVNGLLETFFDSVREATYSACESVFEQSGFSVASLMGVEVAEEIPAWGRSEGSKFSYTEMATKRSECRRLTNYIRLADYIVVDTLRVLALDSVQDMLVFLTPPEEAMLEDEGEEVDEGQEESTLKEMIAKGENASTVHSRDVPLFTVELLFIDNDLVFAPSPEDFKENVDSLVEEFVHTICHVERLTSHETFNPFTQPNINDRLEVNEDLGDGPNLQDILADDDYYQGLLQAIREAMDIAFDQAELSADKFTTWARIHIENRDLDMETMRVEAEAGVRQLLNFKQDMVKYADQTEALEALPVMVDVGWIRIACDKLKELFLPEPQKRLKDVHRLLPILAHQKSETLLSELQEANTRLSSTPLNVKEFVNYVAFLEEINQRCDDIEQRLAEVKAHYKVIEDNDITVTNEDRRVLESLSPEWMKLKTSIELAESSMDENLSSFSKELEQDVADLEKQIQRAREKANDNLVFDASTDPVKAIDFLDHIESELTELGGLAKQNSEFQELFKVPVTQYDELHDAVQEVSIKKSVWDGLSNWDELTALWTSAQFDDIDTDNIQSHINRLSKTVTQAEKILPDNGVVPKLKVRVDEFKATLPVVLDLRNENMKDRHWQKIEQVLNYTLVKDDKFTLGLLLDLKVMDFKDEIQTIAVEASQEAALEQLYSKVVDFWAETDLIITPYKEQRDVFILGSLEDILQNLEDSQMTVSTIAGSRFVGPLKQDVDKLEKQLATFSETLDEWMTCQRQWMYLESIFSAPDIQRQLPSESKVFFQVDSTWKDIMKRTYETQNALRSGTVPGLLDTFQKANEQLDKIQKSLEDYLETKRMGFPRFYFLSNDELLEILAQTKNPHAVQPHLLKCFDNIKALEFSSDAKNPDIAAMISSEGERVPLGKNLKARGNVENWLSAVEMDMQKSLRRLMKNAVIEYETTEREKWVLEHPAQLTIAVSGVFWAQGVVQCLEADNSHSMLTDFKSYCVRQLASLSSVVRGDLSSLDRGAMVALITIEVHARDIVESLIESKVSSPTDFAWQQQLRYEWDAETEDLTIKQTNSLINYGYEYLGASSRLVVTPLTDRCYMTLTGAINLNLGGAPAGPAGTGKTETVKDLAKALARQCVVFNCGESLDYKFMGKFFSGLAQSGAWSCFDEFNRIDIEVLSVIAQQLLTILNGLKQQLPRLIFEDKEIPLKSTFGCFITMNPGYAGRTELPDNLKALFRPVAMMIPDYGLIAEIMLFAEGFDNAKPLSRKMVKLYKLCSEQLSQQDHYDFGMRAVKSVLVMAGALKRGNPDLHEDIVLIRAMKDSNIPKFLEDDVALFEAIVGDLFPGIEIPAQDYGSLESAICEALVEQNKQTVLPFVIKVIQLYETINVRFGVMLVGPDGGGKTTCLAALESALTTLSETSDTETYFPVAKNVLNPKCITMGELYGEFNELTQEWADGLASSIVRQAVGDNTDTRKWTVFDGPVDALWIENMNTVLDDNRTLCLANGERIKLNDSMRMLFEVQDLAVASPATVSRCGMVYIPSETLGWRPFVQSWLTEHFPDISEEKNLMILGTFDEWVPPALAFIKEECKEFIGTNDVHKVTALCALFLSLTKSAQGVKMTEDSTTQTSICKNFFAFAFVWSFGGSITEESQKKFDNYVRSNCACDFPPSETVYDYYFDSQLIEFKQWSDIVPPFNYNAEIPYSQILVPTVDTVRYSFVLEKLLDVRKPALFTGVTGVGKSAIVADLLARVGEEKSYVDVTVQFSAQTSSERTQEMIESKLEKKRKNIIGAPANKHIVLFVDDVNMPQREEYGAQPPIELLRQFLDYGGFYDRKKLFWKEVQDVSVVSACAPPGGGRNPVTPRFFRHFNVLSIPAPSVDCLKTIFASILDGFFISQKFTEDIRKLCNPIIESSVEIFTRIAQELLPTPEKSHYTFNLRDLSKVYQGILQVKAGTVSSSDQIIRLWIHESMRQFHDRLINSDDRLWFTQAIIQMINSKFMIKWSHEEVFEKQPILFGDFMRPGVSLEERQYQEIADHNKLADVLDGFLDEYNENTSKHMKFVFFTDALEHITRMTRILRQPRGNAMLVGVGGSGKQSVTRLACAICEMQCFQIELTRGYRINEFREDLKTLYNTAGVENSPVVFLFTDTQIITESFLEDINNILNSGEVPNLFANDEREKIISDVRGRVRDLGLPETRDVIWNHFITSVRENLHIVITMSPVGDSFRNRCRMFPSLINCCTVDWYDKWPREALLSVARTFLGDVEALGDVEMREKIGTMCVDIHVSVEQTSERFWEELRRRFYTTPKSYLELITLFLTLLDRKKTELLASRERYENGLKKLQETNEIVDSMQQELEELQPVLMQKAAETEKLLSQVAVDQENAEKVKAVVSEEEAVVKQSALETEAIAADAKRDLDEALPALDAAVKALNSLNKSDITEIKSFAKPPALVQTVMEAVCILLNSKTDWDSAKKLLSDTNFLQKLFTYDKDNIPENVLKKLKRYLEDPNFQPDTVAKVSTAAKSLCMWVRAMDVYARVAKNVEPKRIRMREAEAALKEGQAVLKEKQDQLAQVEGEVAILKAKLDNTLAEKKELTEKADLTSQRLKRASKLTSALGDEHGRWSETLGELDSQLEAIVGNVFLASACIAYYGAFNGQYRSQLVSTWHARAKELDMPVSDDFSLNKTFGNPVQIREWHIGGLPTDTVSIDSGIVVSLGNRWPLMIDPQGQANRWVRNMEGKNGLKIIKLNQSNYLRVLETAVRLGTPVLLEDVKESLDPALEPVLQKQVFKQGGRSLIRIGDSDVDYDPKFKFYITTKLQNPHYMPEICIKVTIINFTVTMKGLEDQLLGDVVRKERPDLEESKDRLVVNMAADKKQLTEIEDRILKMLAATQGNILDDEELINTLNESKITSSVIQKRVKEAEQTEVQINAARENYRTVATRGSIMYFVIADLTSIDPMYQYSLIYFNKLFVHCIEICTPSDELGERLAALIEVITANVYVNVCRGLFEAHKLLFSFLLASSILRATGEVNDLAWNFLLRGAVVTTDSVPENPDPDTISDNVWKTCHGLSKMVFLGDVCDMVANNLDEFKEFIASNEPHKCPLPECIKEKITPFNRLVLLKVFREEKIVFGISEFVHAALGEQFVNNPPYQLADVFKDTSPETPIIFVLSTGADPTTSLLRFAADTGYSDRLAMISLGQGQGPIAAELINKASKKGDWVCLQNCHLATSWMPALEKIVEAFNGSGGEKVHPDFRLWLTSMPSPSFPVLVLQNGIKLTNEPPKGLRANLMRTFAGMTEDEVKCDAPGFSRMLFSLSFFHAIVQERRKFGPLGWNILYEFNNSDLEVSASVLRIFLEEQDEIPWDALRYVTGQINYGGRVTDDLDRRCLMSILGQYFHPDVVDKDKSYVFSKSGVYHVPEESSLEGIKSYIDTLPMSDEPEIFGMHLNANIAFQLQETQKLIGTTVSVQPRVATASEGLKPENIVDQIATNLLLQLPSTLDIRDAKAGLFDRDDKGQLRSLSVVLSQEISRFNKLLKVMRTSLGELQKAIKGLVVMSAELEKMFNSFLNNEVPALWSKAAYPSLKPLASWYEDMKKRVEFMSSWLQEGPPPCFWMSGFFFPQGFMTGSLQTHARKYQIPIDSLNFAFRVLPAAEDEIHEPPDDGMYIHGMFLEGAKWNMTKGCLQEATYGQMSCRMPVVHFIPTADYTPSKEEYSCPLYKTSARAGVLSTTGQSTNFVLCVDLKTELEPDHWVKMGTALLTQLNE